MTAVTTDVTLSDPERARLRAIFGCADDAALDAKLGQVARAALQEHLDMFLGTGAFTRGSDFREHRLAMLALHAFGGKIPNEAVVSRMFQSTRSGSRALLRAMMSKYQIRLEGAVRDSLRELLEKADPQGKDGRRFKCDSPAFVERLNEMLGEMDKPFAPIAPMANEAGRYAIGNATYDALIEALKA
jgi:hypothetical protein